MDEKELLVQEETVEITTPQTEDIPNSEVSNGTEPLGNNPETSTGDGSSPEQANPNTSAMGKPTGLFEQLGSQYENMHERATPDGGSITNSVEPQLKKIEASVAFEQTPSENYEANVKVGGLGGNGGVDLDKIDEESSAEYDALVQRDLEIKRAEITHIENQKKVYDFETELQGQQDDGKGILSNAENKNGSGEQVNPETHTLDAHGGVNCKVEENYTEETGAPTNDSNDQFNSGDLMTPKDNVASSEEPTLGVPEDEVEIEDEDITEESDDTELDEDDYEDGKESEDDIPPEETTVSEETSEEQADDNIEVESDGSFDDEAVDPVDGNEMPSEGSYTVERIPGIADDEGHGDDLSEKKDQLDSPNFEEHGVFDGSDQAANVNTDGENGVNEEPTTPEHSQKEETEVEPNHGEKQDNSGDMGQDLDGYGVPEDRSEEGEEPIEDDGFDDENVEPIDPEDNKELDDNLDAEEPNDDVTEEPSDTNVEDENIGEESYGFFKHPSHTNGYYSGFEAEEITVLSMIHDLVD